MIGRARPLVFCVMTAAILAVSACGGSGGSGTNTRPVANAGADLNVTVGDMVVLDGSGSSDADGDKLTYSWRIIASPQGSQARLSDPPKLPAKGKTATRPAPALVPDLPGVYTAELTVNDGSSQSEPDTVAVRASAPGAACGIPLQFGINTPKCPSASPFSWKKLSQCTPGPHGTLAIGAGEAYQYVYVDADGQGANQFTDITIGQGGRLVFLDTAMTAAQTPNLTAASISITGGTDDGLPKGQLVIGTELWPIQLSVVTLAFTGARPDDGDPKKMMHKGIFVTNQGELSLHGQKGVPAAPPAEGDTAGTVSWTYLAAPAGPSAFTEAVNVKAPVPPSNPDTTLTLAAPVDWQPGDWIAVAGTGFVEDQTEFVQIESVDITGQTSSVIRLNPQTPLQHYHFGGTAPSQGTIPPGGSTCNGVTLIGDATTDGLPASFCDGPDRNYGVDERAEVGLISRNIKLTSNAEQTSTKHFGGQIYIGPHAAMAEIEGVEIEKFGQDLSSFQNGITTGVYPIILDTVNGNAAGVTVTVNANSIHHSYNKALGLRGATNLSITNNVAARFIGHGVYFETGNETGNTLDRNLVAGAGATAFTPAYYGLDPSSMPICFHPNKPANLPANVYGYWTGDYLAGENSPYSNGYNSLGVATTSDMNRLENIAPSDFFITNPANTFTNNSAAGSQGQGRGYWLLPATATIENNPLTKFSGNRVHGCYNGVDNAADLGGMGFNHTPTVDGKDVFALYEGVTSTRNRNRGIWLRPSWNVIKDARLATNRAGASLVSAGGPEGSPPGEWGLLKDSVLVGVSENNVERFGPCPCISTDGTCYGMGATLAANGVPDPLWNLGGYMFYDGPARLENNRFVNFNQDDASMKDELTVADYDWIGNIPAGQTPGKTFPDPNDPTHTLGIFHYEGDAAQMWFQSNINGYPPTQYSMGNTWENTDFRHQVYTEETFLAAFTDGDKNTVIVDRDGTLTGYRVYGKQNGQWTLLDNKYAISLNNLPFNGSPWSVDECLATGRQDAGIENRSTSLISPHSYARLVVNGYYPASLFPSNAGPTERFPFTFVKDTFDLSASPSADEYSATWRLSGHYSMTLGGRNNTQNRELQVMNGMGYTIHSDDPLYSQDGLNIAPPMALPRYMGMMFTDADLSTKEINGSVVDTAPFRIRVGLCYKTTKKDLSSTLNPSTFFEVKKGRISLGAPTGGNTYGAWTPVPGCNNFPSPGDSDWDPETGCPGAAVTTLSCAQSYTEFTSQTSDNPLYWWDADKGLLFFFMEQDEVNLAQASPMGSCTGGPDDPPECAISVQGKPVDFFYSCPEDGCVMYTVRVVDQDKLGYDPGNMGCTDCGNAYENPGIDYTQTYPPNDTVSWETDRLGVAETGTVVTEDLIERTFLNMGSYWFPNVLGFNGINTFFPVSKNFPYNIIKPDSAPPDCVASP